MSSAELTEGLSDAELASVEVRFGFEFSPDHRELLKLTLPRGERWPDWRHGDESDLEERLAWPVEGVLFDVENNVFWPKSWGPRPESIEAALAVAREQLKRVPRLVPVYSHRYLPAGPCQPRLPVFSVYQTDTIYYGVDLEDYLAREFTKHGGPRAPDPWQYVWFWSELAEGRARDL